MMGFVVTRPALVPPTIKQDDDRLHNRVCLEPPIGFFKKPKLLMILFV